MLMQGAIHFLENASSDEIIKLFLLRSQASGLSELFELLDQTDERTQTRWINVYNQIEKEITSQYNCTYV